MSCTVSGRVQLVMYRDFATRRARSFGIVGDVHNEENGTVTVIAEGDEEILTKYLAELHKGSVLSRVDNIEVNWSEPTGAYTKFSIRF